jgi:hypothetical protein
MQDVEKVLQRRSHIVQRLNVQPKVRFASSLAAALLEGLFEHPAGYVWLAYDLQNVYIDITIIFRFAGRPILRGPLHGRKTKDCATIDHYDDSTHRV